MYVHICRHHKQHPDRGEQFNYYTKGLSKHGCIQMHYYKVANGIGLPKSLMPEHCAPLEIEKA